jgi:nitroreductase
MSTTVPASDERLFDVMYQCRAIRRFTAEPVPEELLVQLVDAAVHGPSARNAQGRWAFVIVRDAAQKQRVKAVWQRAWAFYRALIEAGSSRPGEDAGGERARRDGDELLAHLEDVPALIFVGVMADPDGRLGRPSLRTVVKLLGLRGTARFLGSLPATLGLANGSDAYPAVQNLLLAARALGLGAVLTTQHMFVPGEFEKILGVPKSFTLAAIVPVGWPAQKFGPTRRPAPRSMISWDRWEPASSR